MTGEHSLRGFVDTPACNCSPVLISLRGHEHLSRPYEYIVDVEVEDIDLETATGESIYVHVTDEHETERHVHGFIEKVELAAHLPGEAMRVRFQVRPQPYQLRYRRGCRIFQELSVPDIARQVFQAAGLPDDSFRWDIRDTYAARDYVVQYNESEWDFVCRLLEDEGIWFAFEHAVDGATMVFGDRSSDVEPLEPATLRFTYDNTRDVISDAPVYDWRRTRRLVEAKVSLSDYDGLRPSLDLDAEAEDAELHAREHYEYPGGYSEAGEGGRRATARLQELQSRRRGARARSDRLDLSPGLRFELLDHPSVAGEFVLVGITLHLDVASRPGADASHLPAQEAPRFELECIPREQLYRPARSTPRPMIHGLQTARVTGPAGEEIHCDEYGRVKVQFHWDRDGALDDKTTCWLRSTHPHTTGSVLVPRIGWEVLVQFYEGDPDRPVVLGHVFNPFHPPDYPLPAEKTVTGHRSVASPGAGVVNEVKFDDASGSQQIGINAGKDLTINAVNNKSMQTANVATKTVAVNRTFSIGADDRISLQANHDDGVGGDQTISIGANRTVKVSANAAKQVAGATTISVGGLENMMIGNPIAAVLDIIRSEAIAAAEGAAASAAERVQGALLGPVAPVLDAVNGALGEAASYAGPASAILGADNPAVALYGDTLASITEATTPPDLAEMAGGMAAAVANDALSAADAGGGGAGSGVWGTTVGGDMSETIGALSALNSAYGINFSVGGSSTETIGAARAEIAKGGHSESAASKTETVGVYFVNASGGFGVNATGAIALNTAASKWKLGKGYAATASGVLAVTAATIDLDAAEAVTLKCGPAEVIIDKSGIGVKGAISVTIEATGSMKVKPPAIGPG